MVHEATITFRFSCRLIFLRVCTSCALKRMEMCGRRILLRPNNANRTSCPLMKKLLPLLLCASGILHAQTFTVSPNAPINDNATTEYTLVVSGLSPAIIDTTNFGLETVCVDLTHTWDSDLNM